MSEYDHINISEIQDILLEDYKIVLDVCKKHGMKVFATGGTALGAVREKGFIPWDDDMDFALSRKEHDYILSHKAEFEVDMPEYLKILRKERSHHMVIADVRYKVKRISDSIEGYINFDFHPIDGAPDNMCRRSFHNVKTFFYRACYKMCDPELVWMGTWRPKWHIILINLMKKCHFLFDHSENLSEKWENSMKKYDYDRQKYIAIYTGKYVFKEIYPKRWFEPGIEMPFEDTTVLVPSGFDNYLHQVYGNYMVPLPESERDRHIS